MPGFGTLVQHNVLGSKILDLSLKEVKGLGLFETFTDRNNLSGGNSIQTNRCLGYIAVVADDSVAEDGSGDPRVYVYTGPVQGDFDPDFILNDDWTDTSNWTEVGGGTGTQGLPGDDGITYSPVVGSVTASAAGAAAEVTLTYGTTSATEGVATFSFVLPRGDQGPTGETGATGTNGTTFTPVIQQVDTLNSASAATASVNAANGEAQFTFGIPAGTTYNPAASVTSIPSNFSPTAAVVVSGSTATFYFGIPAATPGATGETGPTGPAGSINELTDVTSSVTPSNFLFVPSGGTTYEEYSLVGSEGIEVTESPSPNNINIKLDLSELTEISANGTTSSTEVITDGNSGDGFYFAGYDSVQGNKYVPFTEFIAALTVDASNYAVSSGYGSEDAYSGGGAFGDVDGDGTIGVSDLLEILSFFGAVPGEIPNATLSVTQNNLPSNAETGFDVSFPDLVDSGSYTAGDKFYFPIKDETGTTTNFHIYSGGPGVNLTTTGSTDGSDSVTFTDSSSTPYEVAALSGPRRLRLQYFIASGGSAVLSTAIDSDETITLGFDIEYQNLGGSAITGYSASVDLAVISIPVSGTNDAYGFSAQAVASAIADVGASFTFDGDRLIPPTTTTPEGLKIRPWMKSSHGLTRVERTGTYFPFKILLQH